MDLILKVVLDVCNMEDLRLILSVKDWKKVVFRKQLLRKIELDEAESEYWQNIIKAKNAEVDEFLAFKHVIHSTENQEDLLEFSLRTLSTKIINDISEYKENEEILSNLLLNNNRPFYQQLIKDLTNDRSEYSIKRLEHDELTFLNIFQHIVLMVNPLIFQNVVERLKLEYDSGKYHDDIQYDFHKSLRQVDPFDNGHLEGILWSLLQITDIPHRALKRIIKPVEKF